MRLVRLSAPGWPGVEAGLAGSFWERYRGLKAREVECLLLDRQSIHTFGLSSDIAVMALDGSGEVQAVMRVPPGRIVRFPGSLYLIEISRPQALPAVGTTVEVSL